MFRLTFVGDIACDRPLLKAAKKDNAYDFSSVFLTESVFQGSDMVIGNLESCFGGSQYGKKPYHYNVPDSFCTAIKAAGFDLVSTANNHCMDEGVKGLIRTLDVLEQNDIMYTGTFRGNESERYLITEIKGVKVGFYSLTYSVNTCCEASDCKDLSAHVNLLGYKTRKYSSNPVLRHYQTMTKPKIRKIINKIKGKSIILVSTDKMTSRVINDKWMAAVEQQLSELRNKVDVLVVLLHSGGQFNTEPGEFSVYITEHLKKLGADIIIGNHPHTVQRVDVKDDKVVAFSLGGYSLSPSAEYLVRSTLPEYSAALHIDISEEGKIKDVSAQILQCVEEKNHYMHVIEADENTAEAKVIRKRLMLD